MKSTLRKICLLVTLFLAIATVGFSQVELISEANGTMTLRTQGSSKKKDKIISDAEKNAFFFIFYRGIPASSLSAPILDVSEAEAESKFKDYFDNFYKFRYATFVTALTSASGIIKGKHRVKSEYVDVTINITALRKDLEDNQVIRKFGY